jgi:hypothetical protein
MLENSNGTGKWPEKFDVVILNPPFSKDLHFLKKSISLSDGIVLSVQPSSFLIDKKGKSKIYKETKKIIKDKIKSLIFFNGNGIFDIGLYVPCSIILTDKNNTESHFSFVDLQTGKKSEIKKEDLDSISIFGYSLPFISFSGKIKNFLESNKSLQDFSNLKKGNRNLSKDCYYVEFTHFSGRGHRGNHLLISDPILKDDFFTFISRNQLEVKKGKSGDSLKYKIWFEFETREEGENFLNYLISNFSRACLSTTKVHQNLENGDLRSVPWINFKEKWNDEFFYKFLGLEKNEIEFVKSGIPTYYKNPETKSGLNDIIH